MRPAGDIARLSVAVILDDRRLTEPDETGTVQERLAPRAPEDVEKVRALVAAAIGLDPARGDLLTVENIPFDAPAPFAVDAPPRWERYLPQLLEAVRVGAALLLLLALFHLGLRPLVRRVSALTPARATAAAADGRPPALEEVPQQGKIDALATHAATLSQREPETAARLVRAWLAEEAARR